MITEEDASQISGGASEQPAGSVAQTLTPPVREITPTGTAPKRARLNDAVSAFYPELGLEHCQARRCRHISALICWKCLDNDRFGCALHHSHEALSLRLPTYERTDGLLPVLPEQPPANHLETEQQLTAPLLTISCLALSGCRHFLFSWHFQHVSQHSTHRLVSEQTLL